MYIICRTLNVFSSKTTRPVFTRYHTGPSFEGVLSIFSNRSASLNKMAAMPIYNEKHLKIFSLIKKASRLNFVTEHWGLKVIQICSNYDPRLAFDLFTKRSNLRPYEQYRPMHLYGESIENSVSQNVLKTNGWNLQYIITVANPFSYNQHLHPLPRVICPCPWAIYIHV